MKVSKVLFVVSVVSFVITSIVHATPLTDGMVAYWKFEGNAVDQSGRGHDGTVIDGTATYTTNTGDYAFLGQSIQLETSGWRDSSYVSVSDHDDLDFSTNFTIMLWIKPVDEYVRYGNYAISKSDTLQDGYIFSCDLQSWRRRNGVQISLPTTGEEAKSSIEIQVNEWQHVAVSYDFAEEAARFYLNGAFVDEVSISGPVSNSSADLQIGSTSYMDEIILYNTTLSDEQVLYNYTYGASATSPDPDPDPDPEDPEDPEDPDPVAPSVPEPLSIVLLGAGIIGWFIKKR